MLGILGFKTNETTLSGFAKIFDIARGICLEKINQPALVVIRIKRKCSRTIKSVENKNVKY